MIDGPFGCPVKLLEVNNARLRMVICLVIRIALPLQGFPIMAYFSREVNTFFETSLQYTEFFCLSGWQTYLANI